MTAINKADVDDVIKWFWWYYENEPRQDNPFENDEDQLTEKSLRSALNKVFGVRNG